MSRVEGESIEEDEGGEERLTNRWFWGRIRVKGQRAFFFYGGPGGDVGFPASL
jgi:hypothetical protein